ncbi:hypothetical protein IWX49DRAFT_593740 [Phyllosticta citricarpa]|uniref:Uncharacterized protein n=2 Tax=Phyllosticta TaxID=121621 RepID=A0ABR1LN25_9PEZI
MSTGPDRGSLILRTAELSRRATSASSTRSSQSTIISEVEDALQTSGEATAPKKPHETTSEPRNSHQARPPELNSLLETGPEKKKRPHLDKTLIRDAWIWEILSIALSFIALTVMAGILYKIDDKPLNWWTLPIRPNSLISIPAAIAKASLVLPATESISQLKWLYFGSSSRRLTDLQRFDDASRGPWGSFTFLMYFHFKKPTILASMGCIIIVAALALDSFTQQIISYPSRSITAIGPTASTPSAYAYDAGIVRGSGATFDSDSKDDQMQGAIFAGAYGLSSGSLLQCPTGNCTWDPFVTLGVCSSCLDVTAECDQTCSSNSKSDSVSFCSYTTRNDITLGLEIEADGQVRYTQLNSTVRHGFAMEDGGIAQSIILRTPLMEGEDIPTPEDVEIQQCTFSWCLRAYPVQSMENAVATPVSSVNSRLRFAETDSSDYHSIVTGAGKQFLTVMSDNGDVYQINYSNQESISNLLGHLLTIEMSFVVGTGATSDQSFGLDRTLYKSSNLSALFQNVADEMTARLRRSDNVTQVSGEATRTETYICVDWLWFILPVALALGTFLLLQLSMVSTKRTKNFLWKSSLMPLLFHGIEGGYEEAGATDKLSEMESIAESLESQLRRNDAERLKFIIEH